jgi:hypothetical protein
MAENRILTRISGESHQISSIHIEWFMGHMESTCIAYLNLVLMSMVENHNCLPNISQKSPMLNMKKKKKTVNGLGTDSRPQTGMIFAL